jgi:hypothetical protein
MIRSIFPVQIISWKKTRFANLQINFDTASKFTIFIFSLKCEFFWFLSSLLVSDWISDLSTFHLFLYSIWKLKFLFLSVLKEADSSCRLLDCFDDNWTRQKTFRTFLISDNFSLFSIHSSLHCKNVPNPSSGLPKHVA